MKKKSIPQISQLELMKHVRKPMPKPSKVIVPEKAYDRKDKKWLKDIDKT